MDSINLFDTIPEDLLILILRYYKYSEISSINNISASFMRLCDKSLLIDAVRNRIHEEFRFSLSLLKQYNMAQLIRIGTVPKNRELISAGGYHSLILNSDGQIYAFGSNDNGQLGLVDTIDINTPTLIPSLINIISISSGGHYSIALTMDGKLCAFGCDDNGQLGLGDDEDINNPMLIPSLTNIIAISSGCHHSLALTMDGYIYSFGCNNNGQLGLGKLNTRQGDYHNYRNIPTLIPLLSNIIAISTGHDHSLALTVNGCVYGFGSDRYGQLGLEKLNTQSDNKNRKTPTLIPSLSNIIAISAGDQHSLVLTDNGQVYAFGSNISGQLGLGDNNCRRFPTLVPSLTNIIAISAGCHHSLVLDANGQVYAFGNNAHGQLGLGDNYDSDIPTLIPSLSNIIAISTGSFHSLVLNADGYVYTFGYNYSGQLGLGDTNKRNSPTLSTIR